ncbi:glycosyltransferase [Paracoccus contaminans]|uniref:Glycosyl transferase family 1 domain-containing protein n=1 Tax=Paracoccus contaminans TaxID=1945662 RepID=A0A1W6CVS7_9RHOB|nr:glycosyltransferase [Paracoccus contaminans]ARJ68956.1 hypothetical protein B0A89_04245 [Paracoccus contaminans]
MNRTVDLFYHGYEIKALDRPLGRMQSNMHLAARTIYRHVRGRQLYTGFYTAFTNLRRGLEAVGVDVRINDFSHARRNPRMPIGICGFPGVFEKVTLPNPAVFGPGYVPPADQIEAVTGKCNIAIFTQPSEWPCAALRPALGDRIQPLFAPIILDRWPDVSAAPKTHDVLIYDKIHWHRDELVPRISDRLKQHFKEKGLSFHGLRYGSHRSRDFRAALKASRAVAFLSHHETQGLAYQEAMASGLPVFVWNEGKFMDPQDQQTTGISPAVSSAPYFDERCGMMFTETDIETSFDEFWNSRQRFRPREFVSEVLSPQQCARIYLALLDRAAQWGPR